MIGLARLNQDSWDYWIFGIGGRAMMQGILDAANFWIPGFAGMTVGGRECQLGVGYTGRV